MSSSNSFSLFDPSSHKTPKKPERKGAAPATKHPKKEEPESEERKIWKRELLFRDPQIKEIILKIEGIHKEIDEKVAILLEKGGHTANSVKKYLGDPSNFTPQQWKMIQSGQEELEKTIGMALDPDIKKKRVAKETLKTSKERRGKTLGGRKNWMDMR